MPAPVAPLTDSELCGLLVAPPVRRAAAEELMRRHGEAVLACAGVLCGDRQSAERSRWRRSTGPWTSSTTGPSRT